MIGKSEYEQKQKKYSCQGYSILTENFFKKLVKNDKGIFCSFNPTFFQYLAWLFTFLS